MQEEVGERGVPSEPPVPDQEGEGLGSGCEARHGTPGVWWVTLASVVLD